MIRTVRIPILYVLVHAMYVALPCLGFHPPESLREHRDRASLFSLCYSLGWRLTYTVCFVTPVIKGNTCDCWRGVRSR